MWGPVVEGRFMCGGVTSGRFIGRWDLSGRGLPRDWRRVPGKRHELWPWLLKLLLMALEERIDSFDQGIGVAHADANQLRAARSCVPIA